MPPDSSADGIPTVFVPVAPPTCARLLQPDKPIPLLPTPGKRLRLGLRSVAQMDVKERWTRESLEHAFQQTQSDSSAVLLDSFGRKVFRSGGKVIKFGEPVDIQEAQTLCFIKNSGLGIPVPEVYWSGMVENMGVIEMEMIAGDTLQSLWGGLSTDEKRSYAQQLGEMVNRLRSLEGSYIGSLAQRPAVDARRDRNYGGPFDGEAAFNNFLLSNTISSTPKIYRKMLEDLLSTTTHKILFTHGDLSPTNIIVKGGRIVGVVDWEYAGWYPEYWEFVQFFRALYVDYRDYADEIFETRYPAELMTDHFLGHLTRH